VRRALAGVQRTQPPPARSDKLPLTPDMLARARPWFSMDAHNDITEWAAMVVGSLACLRANELVAAASRRLGSALLWQQVTFNLSSSPPSVTLFLPSSKTDQSRRGQSVVVGESASPAQVCAVWALRHLLASRRALAASGGSAAGSAGGLAAEPVFVYESGRPMTVACLARAIRSLAAGLGEQPDRYFGDLAAQRRRHGRARRRPRRRHGAGAWPLAIGLIQALRGPHRRHARARRARHGRYRGGVWRDPPCGGCRRAGVPRRRRQSGSRAERP